MKKIGYFIIGLLLFSVGRAQAQKNLVINGGFEDDELTGWNNGNNVAKITPWDLKSGKGSCAIITTGTGDWIGIDQTIKIPKKAQMLEIGAWIKTNNVVKGKDAWNGAVFIIEFQDAGDKKIGDGINIATLTGYQPWALLKQNVKIPPNAVRFRILLAMSFASGTMLIDDVSAKVISADDVAKS
jgi:hypothetical protein